MEVYLTRRFGEQLENSRHGARSSELVYGIKVIKISKSGASSTGYPSTEDGLQAVQGPDSLLKLLVVATTADGAGASSVSPEETKGTSMQAFVLRKLARKRIGLSRRKVVCRYVV